MKKNKFEFIIDSEFQSQIPALTDEEFQQLEENILSEGEVLSPLIVWGNILVDGHNRYKILQQHPEIPYTTRSISCTCETREDVLVWICKHQLGRRNLTPEQKKFLIGKQYHSEKFIRRRSQLTTSITCFWPSMKSTMPPLRWSKKNSCAPSSSALIFSRKNSRMATGFGTLYSPSLFPIMEKRFENFPWNRNQPLSAYS